MFDGLDELLDTGYRQEITADVESFCRLYPSVPTLVTSRRVGYDQAPLDERNFEVFHISDLDDKRVKMYVYKWFGLDHDLDSPQRTRRTKAFLSESEVVSDLRANPLMLSLMCNIYRGEGYIPKNRPDLYEKCATMLFERWDRSRGIHFPLKIEQQVNTALKHLASWIYSDQRRRTGVTKRELVSNMADYLHLKRFEDRDEAESAAGEFIEFCKGRAWVFTDTGSTREEKLYQFTHSTFLEYFAAAHLVRVHSTPRKLQKILLPRIAKGEWDVVAQLSFQLLSKNVEGATEALLNSLLTQARKKGLADGKRLLSFAARALQFLVPEPKVTRKIAQACIDHELALAVEGRQRRPFYKGGNVVGDLLTAGRDNWAVLATTFRKTLVDSVVKSPIHKAHLKGIFTWTCWTLYLKLRGKLSRRRRALSS